MRLVNFPKVRIKEYPQGFAVEIEKRTWYGRTYWKHIEAVLGIYDIPWYYQDFDTAASEAAKHFKWDLIRNSN